MSDDLPPLTPVLVAGRIMGGAGLTSPCGSFRAEEIRSLTVALRDAGRYQVVSFSDQPAVYVRETFPDFGRAAFVADALNAVWRAVPGATAAQVRDFVDQGVPRAAEAMAQALVSFKSGGDPDETVALVDDALELYRRAAE